MKKEQIFISEEDQAILDYKPRFPFLWRLWMKVWVFFNKIKEP
jgi:hypothetical protein